MWVGIRGGEDSWWLNVSRMWDMVFLVAGRVEEEREGGREGERDRSWGLVDDIHLFMAMFFFHTCFLAGLHSYHTMNWKGLSLKMTLHFQRVHIRQRGSSWRGRRRQVV